jgi:hypothetical protein
MFKDEREWYTMNNRIRVKDIPLEKRKNDKNGRKTKELLGPKT